MQEQIIYWKGEAASQDLSAQQVRSDHKAEIAGWEGMPEECNGQPLPGDRKRKIRGFKSQKEPRLSTLKTHEKSAGFQNGKTRNARKPCFPAESKMAFMRRSYCLHAMRRPRTTAREAP